MALGVANRTMASYWLYEEVLKVDADREPQFAVQSAFNWMKALRTEIEGEHGLTATEQYASCTAHFIQAMQPAATPAATGQVFEPLYASLVYAVSLSMAAERLQDVLPAQPTAVVTWYYAQYFSARAMLASVGQEVDDTHMAVARAVANNLANALPHPLNMRAVRKSGEAYAPSLPAKPQAAPFDLLQSISGDRSRAQGMLLQYLNGTADFYADKTKDRLRANHKLRDFRTKVARQLRDKALERQLGFHHCAFRYRGKANYRDAVFLTYGSRVPSAATAYLADLAAVARFSFLCAVAFVGRRVGQSDVRLFASDLLANLRGLDVSNPAMYFWKGAF